MSTCPSGPKTGLGTAIVEALARHLHADVGVSASGPGAAIAVSGSAADTMEV